MVGRSITCLPTAVASIVPPLVRVWYFAMQCMLFCVLYPSHSPTKCNLMS